VCSDQAAPRRVSATITGMPERNLRLTAARRRALTILIAAPEGCTEATMTAHGFSLEFLADLARDGLVNETVDRVRKGKREIDVVRLSITAEGRRAIDH
jgi:hypothetical protein